MKLKTESILIRSICAIIIIGILAFSISINSYWSLFIETFPILTLLLHKQYLYEKKH